MRQELTAERLRELLDYDPETGVFTWKKTSGKAYAGATCGWRASVCTNIGIAHKNYKAHRLAWLYVHGEWPKGVIDHINGDPWDNRIANLRDVTQSINQQNRRRARAGSASGLLGAMWDARRGRWISQIRANGTVRTLGRFDSPEAAHAAYLAAKRRLHEGCTI